MCPALGGGRTAPVSPLLGDQGERLGDELGLLTRDPGDRSPGLTVDVCHPPPEQGMAVKRDQRCLVSPVLDEPPVQLPGAVAGDAVQPPVLIGPEPREDRHVVRA
jgi:hypothetical protein